MKTRILFTMAICGICSVAIAQNTNTKLGDYALSSIPNGYRNIAVGDSALAKNTSGYGNSAVGYKTLKSNTQGWFNTALGGYSLSKNNSYENTAVGYKSQEFATGLKNVSLGYESLQNSTGFSNVAIGNLSMHNTVGGSYNTALGYLSFENSSGSCNTAIGSWSLRSLSSKSENVAIGYKSQESANGYSNTSLGVHSLKQATGTGNIAVGVSAMRNASGGTDNIAVGKYSLDKMTSGYRNAGVGMEVLRYLTTGYENVGLGVKAGESLKTGTRNIIIGPYTNTNANSSYNIIMGYRSAAPTGDNNIVIGKKITLPAGTSNGLNIGGVLFGSGLQSALPSSPTSAPANGKIGINVVNPQATLDVNGNILSKNYVAISGTSDVGGFLELRNENKIQSGIGQSWKIYNMTDGYGNSLQFWTYDNIGCSSGGLCASRLTLMDNGNIGIGTTNPQHKLDVDGTARATEFLSNKLTVNNSDNFTYDNKTLDHYSVGWYPDSWSTGGHTLWQSAYGGMKFFTTGQLRAAITDQGNFGIGTENPQYKLDVNGIIRAREVKIEVSGGADFVFEPSYRLRPLNELRTYVSENKRLPDIPSAAEMTDKGVDMGDFQVKLLQKIEELTLYIMEQDRRIKELENR